MTDKIISTGADADKRLGHLSSDSYFRWMTGSALCVAILAVALNFLVDPYYVFNFLTLDGINRGKPATINRTGFAKTYMVEWVPANSLILGASRMDVGLDPDHAAWHADLRPVFNFGVPGASMYGRLRYLQHAAAMHRPKMAIVSLEFGQFLDADSARPVDYPPPIQSFEKRLSVTLDGAPTPYLGLQRVRDRTASLLSTTAVLDSIDTLGQQDYVSPTELGFSSGAQRFGSEIANKGSYSVMRDVTEGIARRMADGVTFRRDADESVDFQALRGLLRYARDEGIQLMFVIPPSHVFEYEIWDRFGLWDDFEIWKSMILREIEASNRSGMHASSLRKTPDVVLWDFSGYSAENSEQVPEPGDRSGRMRWFWEPVHFTSELGDLVIASMMSPSESGYGRILTEAGFCGELEKDRQARARYRRGNPGQLLMLDGILGESTLEMAVQVAQNPVEPVCAT